MDSLDVIAILLV